ncbi:MAG: thioredoxin family protein [Phaeodactylibacter sp.]|nr:thioredoxin family protein [Phaeodactylibacter sp.]MCB9277136.1 thioredoxin family protein [Lewinellaceae bacterium]
MQKLFIYFALLITAPAFSQSNATAPGQSDTESIDGIVTALYDVISGPALQPRDWDRFRSLFVPQARLNAVRIGQDGQASLVSMSVEDYIQRVDKQFYMNGFFERELFRQTDTYANITQLFSTYESRQEAEGPVIARGINSIQLAYYEGRYWVAGILWNGEAPDNPIPPQYLPRYNQQTVNHENEIIMVGKINRMGLEQQPYGEWFKDGYASYAVDEAALKGMDKKLGGIKILVFMGTWCSDSQREVPHLYKILDYLGYDMNSFSIVAVNDHPDFYKQSPQHEEQGWNIEYVPTIIFLKEGKELGRIVEAPVESLEKDMVDILR